MADAASAIIGIVAFGLHAAHRIYDVLDSIQGASEEVEALRAEACRVHVLLMHIHDFQGLETLGAPQGGLTLDGTLIADLQGTARALKLSVDKFTQKVAKYGRDGRVSVNALQWLLKKNSGKRLREQFNAFYLSLNAVFSIATSHVIISSLSVIAQSQESLLRDNEECHIPQQMQLNQVVVAPELRTLDQGIPHSELTGNQDRTNTSSEVREESSSSIRNPLSSVPTISSSSIQPTVSLDTSHHDAITTVSGFVIHRTNSTLSVTTPPHAREPVGCLPGCACCCHSCIALRAINYWLYPYFGALFISRPLLRFVHSSFLKCNEQTCQRIHSATHYQIKYFFPTWFFDLEMKLRMKAIHVRFYLQTPRLVPDTSPIFHCIRSLDTDGVRELLVSGAASVNDINSRGFGLLHYAATCLWSHPYPEVAEMFKFLIKVGAHPEWEDTSQRTALDLIMQYQYIPELHPRPDFGWSSALQLHVSRPLFSLDAREAREDWMEKSKHTAIHRALLCHADADAVPLKDVVATSKGDVDTPCRIYGWTPMEWGIFMYVPDVVEILLEGGADLKKGYPLHRAANTGNIQALRSLMHAGADINLQDEMGRTPLHFIAYEGKDAAATELFKFGGTKLRWDALSIFGHTPLERAQHGRSYFSALGLNVDGHDRIIQSLSALQEARRREAPSLENSIAFRDQLTVHHGGNAIPGSFLEEWIGEHFVYNRGIDTHT